VGRLELGRPRRPDHRPGDPGDGRQLVVSGPCRRRSAGRSTRPSWRSSSPTQIEPLSAPTREAYARRFGVSRRARRATATSSPRGERPGQPRRLPAFATTGFPAVGAERSAGQVRSQASPSRRALRSPPGGGAGGRGDTRHLRHLPRLRRPQGRRHQEGRPRSRRPAAISRPRSGSASRPTRSRTRTARRSASCSPSSRRPSPSRSR
jgi:hypothetical protein